MILQGEDKALSITISDSAKVLQSIDDMIDLIVYLHLRNGTIVQKFSKEEAEGFTTLLRVSATLYTAIIPHTLTKDQPISELMVEVEIQETDDRFAGDIRRTKGKGKITSIGKSLITE